MIPLEEARRYVLDGCRPLPPVTLPVESAAGLVLADEVVSAEAVPPFDNTAMDGFAVRADDVAAVPTDLEIVGTLAAGAAPDLAVGAGQAVRIMTGAPIPPGADAVVMVELTQARGTTVTVTEPVAAGNHVRRAGEDLQVGQPVFEAGTVLTPGHLGVLLSIGVQEVAVHPRLRVGVMSTGDELVEGGGELRPGQIRDSNRRTLLALLADLGVEPVDVGLIRDDEQAIKAAIEGAVADCDALLSTGGVSMGDFDYVKSVLDEIADMRWMQVAIRPAKPLAFGRVGDVPVFGLPGNPVSSMVSYELFARPALRKLMGHRELDRPRRQAVATTPLRRRADGKTHFARVRVSYVDGAYQAETAGGQGSHQLHAMATANALAVLPDGDGVEVGGVFEVILLT